METRSLTPHGHRHRRLTALTAIALALGMMVPAVAMVMAATGPFDGSLSGTVTDASTGAPLENALVTLRYHEITRTDYTDASGKYAFDKVPLCYCLKNLSARKDGYEDWSQDVAVGVATVVDIALEPDEGAGPSLYGTLSGTVTDADTGAPLEDALVTLKYHGLTRTTMTDAEGAYSFDDVPICFCLKNLSASKEGYEDWSEDVAVGGKTIVDIELELEEDPDAALYGTLSGTVTDADTGMPLQDVLMTLKYHGLARTTLTDDEGVYSFDDVPLCFCLKNLSASKEGYEDWSEDVAVGEETVVDIELKPLAQEPETGTLSGTVTDADTGEPVGDARVTIAFHDTTESTLTDAEGRYVLTGIPICRCLKNVTVEKDGYETKSELVGVHENTVKDFELVPEKEEPDGGRITGVVTDAETDEPIEGAKVTVSYHGIVRTTWTDAEGRYTVTGVPECYCLKEVKVSVGGYHGQSKSVGVYGTTFVDFALQPRDSGDDGAANGITGGDVMGGMTGQQIALTGLMGGVLVLVVSIVYMLVSRRTEGP